MAQQTFEIQFIDLIGEALAADLGIDTGMLDDWGSYGVRDIIGRLPTHLLDHTAASTSLAVSTGTAITSDIILGVTRTDGAFDRPARKVSHLVEGRVQDIDDMLYALPNDPVWLQKNGKIYVYPAPTAIYKAFISAVAYTAVDADVNIAIAGFPDGLEPRVVDYMVIRAKIREAGLMRRDSQNELEAITTAGYLASFESALPSYVNPPAPTIPTLTLPPDIVLPSLSLTTAPTFAGLTLPTPPAKALAYTSAGAAPSSTVAPGVAPVFSPPTAFTYSTTVITDALDQMEDMMDNSGLGSSDVEAYIDTDHDLEKARVGIQAIQAEGVRANTAIQDELAQLREYEAELQEASNRFNTEVSQYGNRVQEEVQEVQAGIASYSAKAQDNANDLQEQISQYQHDINNYQAQSQAEIQEWTSEEVQFKLAKWNGQVRSETEEYQQKSSAAIGEYNGLASAKVGEFSANSQQEIGEYAALSQAEAARVQVELAKARSYLEEAAVRLQTMQSFDQKSTAALQEVQVLKKMYVEDINDYIKGKT